jgi:hypothetical protein
MFLLMKAHWFGLLGCLLFSCGKLDATSITVGTDSGSEASVDRDASVVVPVPTVAPTVVEPMPAPRCGKAAAMPQGPQWPALVSLDARGAGACATTTLGEALEMARALRPDLSDIGELRKDRFGIDGSYVLAYQKPDGGFALVFKRGLGDCPAGCTANEYYYFQTNGLCAIEAVGEYKAGYGAGNCLSVTGVRQWGVPAAPDQASVCGADATPQNVSGARNVYVSGGVGVCPKDKPGIPVESCAKLVIAQSKGDLSKGTVQLLGTGDPKLEEPMPATFVANRFSVHTETKSGNPQCPDMTTIDLSYDPARPELGRVQNLTVRFDADCRSYCKEGASFTLFEASEFSWDASCPGRSATGTPR